MLNFTASILELIWCQNHKIKMAVSQELFKIQISNFRIFLLSGRGTIDKYENRENWRTKCVDY